MSHTEFHGLKQIGKQIVLVGIAIREFNGDKPHWACEKLDPNEGNKHIASTDQEAINWLIHEADADYVACMSVFGSVK